MWASKRRSAGSKSRIVAIAFVFSELSTDAVGCSQSDDVLLLEPLSDFDDLLPESDLLDDSLAFLSAAAPLL